MGDERCQAEVPDPGGWRFHKCGRKALPSGFCGTHDPDRRKERAEKRGPTAFEREMAQVKETRERIATLTRERDEALLRLHGVAVTTDSGVWTCGDMDCGNAFCKEFRASLDDTEHALASTPAQSLAEHDKALARLVSREAEVVELREALYPLVVGCFEADAREDAPEFSNGEASRGRDALGDCPKCCGSGSTDGDFYEDRPIPAHLVCPDCGGWGFLKHQNGATGALDRVLAEHDKAVEARVAERCAKLCEEHWLSIESDDDDPSWSLGMVQSAKDCAAAIRREFGVTR